MKKLLAFILAAVMTASLCACGSSKGGAEGSTSAKGSSAAGEAVAASDIKVGCIMIGDENEGYTEAHLKAVEASPAISCSRGLRARRFSWPP